MNTNQDQFISGGVKYTCLPVTQTFTCKENPKKITLLGSSVINIS